MVRFAAGSGVSTVEQFIDIDEQGGELRLSVNGHWSLETAVQIDRKLRDLGGANPRTVILDASRLTGLDSAGAFVLRRTADMFDRRGIPVDLVDLPQDFRSLYDKAAIEYPNEPVDDGRPRGVLGLFYKIGLGVADMLSIAGELFSFFGFVLTALAGLFTGRNKLRFAALINQIEAVGLTAIPIVGLLCFLVGIVLAYMGSLQLERFGAAILTVNLVGVSVLREIGVLLTAIIVAGRSGSAFTAEIGSMKVSQEVDALETLGLTATEVLVIPRVLGLMISLPLLTFFGDIMGLLGGAMIAVATLDLTFGQFLTQLKGAVDFWDYATGMIKSPVFAFVIALVGCYQGLQVSGNAQSVGSRTTRSVVNSIFAIIVLDAAFAVFFAQLGI